MKPISYYLDWPITKDLEKALSDLPWDKKFELSVALSQVALDEKRVENPGKPIEEVDQEI